MKEEELFDIDKYLQAIEKAVVEAPLRHGDVVELSDLWIITSLPNDLIVECVKSEEFVLPEHVKKIVSGKRVLLRNKNYKPFEEKKEDQSSM